MEEGQQPGVCLKEAGRRTGLDRGQLLQIHPDVGDQPGHPGDQGTRVGEPLQVTVGAVDDLAADQQVSQLLGAAEASLEQVAPAAADSPQASAGPVPGEDGFPLLADELLPAECHQFFEIVVVHGRQTMATAPNRQARGRPTRRDIAPAA